MGPNQVRIMDQMASLLSVRPQVSFIKTGTYEGIGQRQETIKGTEWASPIYTLFHR